MLASSVSKNSALRVSGERDLVRFEVPQERVLRLGGRGAEVEIPRLGEVARSPAASGGRAVPGSSAADSPGSAAPASRDRPDRAARPGRTGRRAAGRYSSARRLLTAPGQLSSGGIRRSVAASIKAASAGVEKAVGRWLRRLASSAGLALRRLCGGGFRRERGRRSHSAGAEQQARAGRHCLSSCTPGRRAGGLAIVAEGSGGRVVRSRRNQIDPADAVRPAPAAPARSSTRCGAAKAERASRDHRACRHRGDGNRRADRNRMRLGLRAHRRCRALLALRQACDRLDENGTNQSERQDQWPDKPQAGPPPAMIHQMPYRLCFWFRPQTRYAERSSYDAEKISRLF